METPYKLFVMISVYLIYDGLYPVSAQSGPNVCDRRETYYGRARVCAYRTWLSCCYYRYVLKCYYRNVPGCCSGYTNVGGRCEPVCFGNTGKQGCNNVGDCVGPNTCRCQSGYSGPQCNSKIACSETRPCYPGSCPSADSCQCSDGFGSTNCTTILASPIITLASAVLAYNHPIKRMDIYNYTTDATTENDTESGDSASIWANFNGFNRIRGTVSAAFGLELSAPPSYVTSSTIGVTVATMEWQLEKLKNSVLTKEGGNSSTCSEVSANNPGRILQECQIEFNNVLRIDSGDVFTLTFRVENGGYENLRGGIRLPFTQQSYKASNSSVIYRIDLDKPTVNTDTAFIVNKPFTKTQIVTRWSGWSDSLAGMESYNWEIFELRNKSGTQRYATRSKADCINPQLGPDCNPFLDPIFSKKFNHTGGELSMSYTPPKPGVFAMILEASDKANNSDYVARYVVYDPSSTIEIQTGNHDIKALSGSNNASFKWQVLSASSQSGLNLTFSWKGHFINRLHHEGGFLNNIENYAPQLQDSNTGDNRFPKTVNVKYNVVGENGLTRDGIPNELGITKFQTYIDETGQQKIDVNTGVSWIDQNIKTTASFPLTKTISEGNFVTLWVKAEDKIGNVKLSSLPLGFDASEPTIYNQNFMPNMGTKYLYGSKLWFKTADQHSGISQIYFNIKNKSNGTIAANGSVPVKTSNVVKGFPDERYQIRDTFYFYQQELEINNCWFRVPKSRQATDRFAVEIIAYNGAMLQAQQVVDVDLNSFKGIGQYQAVKDVNLLQNTGNGVRFSFNLTESCYRRQNIILKYNDGQAHEKLINPSADKYDLLGLQPLTAYNVSFVVEYDEGDTSDPLFYSFRTGSVERQFSQGLTSGGLAGIVVAACLLLLFVIFILVMWRTGRLRKVEAVVIAPIRNTVRRRRDGNSGAIGYKQYTTGGYDQDEIYMYGEYAHEKEPDWHFRIEDVTMDTLLKTGRFAMIYKATLYKHGKSKECVAKTLRDGYSDEDKMLMKAKINFFGAKVGEHPCVLGFIGAVVAEQSMGPIMLLEYCENGTLKDWLADHQKAVSDDVIESLFRFSYDITRGMVYLASKDIIHMRLAARNVYLNKSLSAKIAGFGPRQGDDEDESGKKERIPVKWMAPECLNKTGTASEKSDVWSYGITIWEIFSIGATPYENVRSRDLPKWLKQGNILSKPEYTDDLHFEIMKKCWNLKPSGRPSFANINKEIESLFRQSSGDLYYYDSSQK